MAAGVCSPAAAPVAVFGPAPRIFGRDFLGAPYSQLVAFVFGTALNAPGAVFRRFDNIMQAALDMAREVTKNSQDHDEPNANH